MKKVYKITFRAELSEDDVRAMQKYFYDTMNEGMDIHCLWGLELEEEESEDTTIDKSAFTHINDVWEFLDQFNTLEDLENACSEIPSKFGSFEVVNKDSYKDDGHFDICNSFWCDGINGYEYDYHCVDCED